MYKSKKNYYPKKYPRRGDVWMVDFKENIGSEQNGVRPSIVLNNPIKKERTCVVIPASTTKRHHSFEVKNYNFLIHQVRVVDISRLIRRITRFEKESTDMVYKKLNIFLE